MTFAPSTLKIAVPGWLALAGAMPPPGSAFTPDWLCGVWVGDDDNRPMSKVAGGDVPAEIWRRFMLAAHQGLPPRDFPFLGETPAAAQAAPDSAAPAARAEARTAFYQNLSSEFASAELDAAQPAEPAQK